MSKTKNPRPAIINQIDQIQDELNNIGLDLNLFNTILKDDAEYLLINKVISSADVVTKGKFPYKSEDKYKKDSFSKETIEKRCKRNTRFYIENADMENFELKNKKNKVFFIQTKQSNIHLPKEFYQFLNIGESYRNRRISYIDKTNGYDVYIVNSFIDNYFDYESTNELLKSYGREENASKVKLEKGNFTECRISFGQHGVGLSTDKCFHSLRNNIFAKDSIYFFLEKRKTSNSNNRYKVYIMPYRNTKFYLKTKRPIPFYAMQSFNGESVSKKENRRNQAKWRKHLADLYISRSMNDENIITCPFTGLEVRYPSEFTIMRASHIKAYKDCKNDNEAYDLDNGFLLSANVDALFDKYLISVNPKTLDIVSSKQISSKLKSAIHLKNKLNKKDVNYRMVDYLTEHYKQFIKKNR